MRYLKLFNESIRTESWIDKDYNSAEEIAKIIDDYFRESEYTDIKNNMDDLLTSVHPDGDYQQGDLMEYDDILSSVCELIENYNEDWYKSKFVIFLDLLYEIEEDSKHGISTEEIEDFFLDLEYKYEINRTNTNGHPSFSIDVYNVDNDKVMMLMNQFWNTVDKRLLPLEYTIYKIEVKKGYSESNILLVLISLKEISDSSED